MNKQEFLKMFAECIESGEITILTEIETHYECDRKYHVVTTKVYVEGQLWAENK